jgi:periplasmic protein TonB
VTLPRSFRFIAPVLRYNRAMLPERAENVIELPRRARHGRHPRWRAAWSELDARMLGLERRMAGLDRHYRRFPVPERLRYAIAWSVLVHLAVLFGVTFKPASPSIVPPQPQLEVALVNAFTAVKPEKAEALAQHNLDGGGNTDEKRRAQNPLPLPEVPAPKTDLKSAGMGAEPVASKPAPATAELESRTRRVQELEQEAKQLMAQPGPAAQVEQRPPAPQAVAAEPAAPAPVLAAAPTPPAAPAAAQTSPGLPSATEILQSSFDIARLEAKITRDWEAYQQRPRRRFVGARTQEFRFARYVEDWRHKIERVGELNYPQAARDQRAYGSLVVTVSIRSDGSLEKFEIHRPSGQKILDEAARRIVDLAAPFAPFPPEIAKDTDVLSITRTWTFTRADRLVAD